MKVYAVAPPPIMIALILKFGWRMREENSLFCLNDCLMPKMSVLKQLKLGNNWLSHTFLRIIVFMIPLRAKIYSAELCSLVKVYFPNVHFNLPYYISFVYYCLKGIVMERPKISDFSISYNVSLWFYFS
jgi:hypothetical protein